MSGELPCAIASASTHRKLSSLVVAMEPPCTPRYHVIVKVGGVYTPAWGRTQGHSGASSLVLSKCQSAGTCAHEQVPCAQYMFWKEGFNVSESKLLTTATLKPRTIVGEAVDALTRKPGCLIRTVTRRADVCTCLNSLLVAKQASHRHTTHLPRQQVGPQLRQL